MPRQKLPNPRDHTCEWCDETATKAHERKAGRKHLGTQQYIFTCTQHDHLAEQVLAKKPREYKL